REGRDASILFPPVLRAEGPVAREIGSSKADHIRDARETIERAVFRELGREQYGESDFIELHARPERPTVGKAILAPSTVGLLGGDGVAKNPPCICRVADGEQAEGCFDCVSHPDEVVAAGAVA